MIKIVTSSVCPKSAEGLECHGNRFSTDGALVELSGALEAKGAVPARHQRAVDLCIHAYLATRGHRRSLTFCGMDVMLQQARTRQDMQHPAKRPRQVMQHEHLPVTHRSNQNITSSGRGTGSSEKRRNRQGKANLTHRWCRSEHTYRMVDAPTTGRLATRDRRR